MESDVRELCRKLKPIYGNKIDALWFGYVTEDADGRREIETTLNILAAKTLNQTFDSNRILLSPPEADSAAGEYPIGSVCYNNRLLYPFGIREQEWIQHVAVFGRSGAGKTNLVFEIVGSLLKAQKPFLIFDWKRNYRDLLAKYSDAEMLVFTVGRSIAPIQFNPLIPPAGTDARTWLKKLIEIIATTYYLGEGVKFLLQKAIDAVYKASGVYKGLPEQWPTMKHVLKWLNDYEARGRESNWMVSTLRAVHVLCFGEMGRVINVPQQMPLEKLLEKNVILELDSLTNTDKSFFIQTLLLWIHHYRLSEPAREQFKHAIIIEEAHHILLKQEHSSAESIIDVVLREIRELGTAIVLVDQHPSLISLPALGNTYTTITMNLKAKADVNAASNYTLMEREDAKCFGRLEVGEAIVKLQGRCMSPFLIRIPLVRIPKGTVTDSQIQKQMQGYSGYSRAKSRSEEESGAGGVIPPGAKVELSEEEKRFLEDIASNPLCGVAKRYRRIGISTRKGNMAKQRLMESGLIEEVDIRTRTGKTVLLKLTGKGMRRAGDIGIKLKTSGRPSSLEHEYWKEKVADYMESKGFRVEREKKLGRGKAIDLEVRAKGKRFAVEIETGNSDAVSNVEKDLAAGVEYVLTVVTNSTALQKIRKRLSDKGLDNPEKVRVVGVSSPG